VLDELAHELFMHELVDVRHKSHTSFNGKTSGVDVNILEIELAEDSFSGIPQLRLIFFLLIVVSWDPTGHDSHDV
jgi:hypothetical protein